ncbi:MAG: Ni/Fe hydrogenase subunit alpha [Gammaproteobacteria bacterium]|nr:Ni/Fe hydrogenase subunit alpha [Gammaproteobacteria bacterium]MCP5137023.1 Ni/Fe hydrogenase subunit alpha [Gammaproteobacteria bacterium]
MSERHLDIRVPAINRVEGEGALDLVIHGGRIEQLAFRIFEPPRLFEKLLEGREYTEVPDLTARICGICPVAYQMSAATAIEQGYGVTVSAWTERMRRVLYCGEWIQSHALHIHLLALPDFLGYENSFAMAADYRPQLRRGMALQRLGNDLIALFGGRSVHPVGATIGGFFKAPDTQQVSALCERLSAASDEAIDLVRWLASISVPKDKQDFASVALSDGDNYPMFGDRLTSNAGLDIDVAHFEQHVIETQSPHSTALHAHLDGKPYLVGPLARMNLAYQRLPSDIAALLDELGPRFPSDNMFDSLLARGIELLYALHQATDLLGDYVADSQPRITPVPREGRGMAATEAPRGVLYHRYDLGTDGLIKSARLVPPTSQNQARMEQDLANALEAFGLDQDRDSLRHHAETVIRNYDPCISCATHFLRLNIDSR